MVELDWTFSQLQHRPGELIDFVWLWIADQPAVVLAAALEAFKAKTRPDAAFEQPYAACTPLQKAVLDGISRGQPLFSSVTRRQIAASLGLGEAIAPSTLASAVAALETRGILSKVARGQYRLEDEHFGSWPDLISDKAQHAHTATVIPAHAGIHWVNAADRAPNARRSNEWIPAFAGMTTDG